MFGSIWGKKIILVKCTQGKILSTWDEIIRQGEFEPPSDILNFKGDFKSV